MQNHFIPEYEKNRILPIIPIKETEAWLLVDFEAFKNIIGTNLGIKELSFPLRPHQVEAINDPKENIKKMISIARTKRRRIDLDEIYEGMGEKVSIELLAKVPSFQEFHREMSEFLKNKLRLELEQL